MKKFTMFALFFAALVGCQNDDNGGTTEPVTVAFSSVQMGNLSGEPLEASNFVINTSAEWNLFRTLVNSAYGEETDYDVLAGISVDFEEYTVLAVLDQWWGSGGYSMQITSVVDNGNELHVGVDFASVDEGNATSVHCQPYHIIKIPKTTLPVVFED